MIFGPTHVTEYDVANLPQPLTEPNALGEVRNQILERAAEQARKRRRLDRDKAWEDRQGLEPPVDKDAFLQKNGSSQKDAFPQKDGFCKKNGKLNSDTFPTEFDWLCLSDFLLEGFLTELLLLDGSSIFFRIQA